LTPKNGLKNTACKTHVALQAE